MKYKPQKIESKWQKTWKEQKLYETKDKVSGKNNYMALVEFPYPSGNLHIGHWYAFAVPDISVRFLKMKGYNVMYPIGFDAFGLPAENAAIKNKINPRDWTKKNIAHMTKQLKSMGAGFDWTRAVSTIDPEYYKWTQWMFLKMYEKGLAYRAKTTVNWCPSCKTVLANEQVLQKSQIPKFAPPANSWASPAESQDIGFQPKSQIQNSKHGIAVNVCERCETPVVKKELEQWMFRITDYAERLINDLQGLDWPEATKLAQKNWIGRSEGAEIEFKIVYQENAFSVPLYIQSKKDEKLEWLLVDLIDLSIKNKKRLIVSGGWGIDIYAGRRVRAHDDIDLNVFYLDAAWWKEQLEKRGFKQIKPDNPKKDPRYHLNFIKNEEGETYKVDIIGIGFNDKAEIFDMEWGRPDPWGFLKSEIVRKDFMGRKVEIFSASVQLWLKVFDREKDKIDRLILQDGLKKSIKVFTTRPDTLFGATYVVLGPEHLLLKNNELGIKNYEEVEDYIKKAKARTEEERIAEGKDPSTGSGREKTGVELKGIKAINPANKEEIPVWVADYVLGHVGTGAIMAVPAHDQRDFEFARKYNLPVKIVICPHYPQATCPILDEAYEGNGHLVDSGRFNGMPSDNAKDEVIKFVGGENKIQYRLHDWVLSRQRYWGAPIPMINCGKCGWQPISENDLPVKLPPLKDFMPTDEGRSPLAKAEKWARVKCPKCNEWAERETDTMDTFVDSSWYFIRYTDPQNKNKFADEEKMKLWLPVPLYIGGAEHNTMHLLYSRFFTKVLYDLGFINFSEPFTGRKNHGIILGPDFQKMSKSRGNVIDPDKEVIKYGADTVRMYLAFMGPYDQGGPWNPGGINGIHRFLNRVCSFVNHKSQIPNHKQIPNSKSQITNKTQNTKSKAQNDLTRLVHKTIKKVTEDIENLRYNTAISALMVLLNELEKNVEAIGQEEIKIFLKLLAPFAPHLTEELWSRFRKAESRILDSPSESGQELHSTPRAQPPKSIHLEPWPEYDSKLIQENIFELVVQINGKVRDSVEVAVGISEKDALELVLKRENIKKHTGGRVPKKVIFIPNRLINLVIA